MTKLLSLISAFLAELISKIIEKLHTNRKLIQLGKEKQKRKDAEADAKMLKKDAKIDADGDVNRDILIDRLRGKK